MATSSKLLITGAKGMLGRDLVQTLARRYDVTGVDIDDFDICDRDAIIAFIGRVAPEVVVHAAAYTDVNGCESDSDRAQEVNVSGTANVVAACKRVGAHLVYYSTDYVFDGTKGSPYVEDDEPCPLGVYGRTKYEGEQLIAISKLTHTIVRISWLYGSKGDSFVKKVLRLGQKRVAAGDLSPLPVVCDQRGNPTWTAEVVRQTRLILDHEMTGVVHCSSDGVVSWLDFARAIFDIAGLAVPLQPQTTAEYVAAVQKPDSPVAPRPALSALVNQRLRSLGCDDMRHWRVALEDFLGKHKGEIADEL